MWQWGSIMPLDQPTYPGERRIPLGDFTISGYASGFETAAFDDDPETAAVFDTYLMGGGYDGNGNAEVGGGIQPGGQVAGYGGRIWLTHPGTHAGAGSYHVFSQETRLVAAFRMRFKFRIEPGGYGICFVLNRDTGNHAGTSGAGMGYAGDDNTFALKLGGKDNRIGIFSNGAMPTGGTLIPSNVLRLASGREIAAELVYDGTTLNVSLQDVASGDPDFHYEQAFAVDIPAAINGTEAVYGFTSSTDATAASHVSQQVWDWHLAWGETLESLEPERHFYGNPPRFLRVDWGEDRFISRVRIGGLDGPGSPFVGISFESSLGYVAQGETGEPPEVPLPYVPLPDGEDVYSIELAPPLLARGVVFYPDAFLEFADLPDSYLPEVLLSQLQVYEFFTEGETAMADPTVKRSRVGVQEVMIYKWNGAAGPYDATTRSQLEGLQELGISIASESATVTGGETVHTLGAFETARETTISVSNAISDLKALEILLGGTLIVDPAAGGLGEVQYHTQNLGDRAPYFRCIAKSSNGDGTDRFVWAKCRINGDISFNLQKDQVTNLEFSFVIVWDRTYVRQDGEVGGIFEWLFGEKGEEEMHS
jgi:hypothetical protein